MIKKRENSLSLYIKDSIKDKDFTEKLLNDHKSFFGKVEQNVLPTDNTIAPWNDLIDDEGVLLKFANQPKNVIIYISKNDLSLTHDVKSLYKKMGDHVDFNFKKVIKRNYKDNDIYMFIGSCLEILNKELNTLKEKLDSGETVKARVGHVSTVTGVFLQSGQVPLFMPNSILFNHRNLGSKDIKQRSFDRLSDYYQPGDMVEVKKYIPQKINKSNKHDNLMVQPVRIPPIPKASEILEAVISHKMMPWQSVIASSVKREYTEEVDLYAHIRAKTDVVIYHAPNISLRQRRKVIITNIKGSADVSNSDSGFKARISYVNKQGKMMAELTDFPNAQFELSKEENTAELYDKSIYIMPTTIKCIGNLLI